MKSERGVRKCSSSMWPGVWRQAVKEQRCRDNRDALLMIIITEHLTQASLDPQNVQLQAPCCSFTGYRSELVVSLLPNNATKWGKNVNAEPKSQLLRFSHQILVQPKSAHQQESQSPSCSRTCTIFLHCFVLNLHVTPFTVFVSVFL